MNTSKTHNQVIDLLKQKGCTDIKGGVQLFADQYDDYWSVSVNFSSTGIHIPKSDINTSDLDGDELIQICKTWTYKEKEN